MKSLLVLCSSSLLLCSCADMVVTNSSANGGGRGSAIDSKDYGSVRMTTNCGVGASEPKAIYIRPFCIDNATFQGDETVSEGEMPIRKAIVPVSFAGSLKEELERIAPARVLKDNESPRTGWLVTGDFKFVDGGDPVGRFFLGHFGVGRSYLALHVRVTDVDRGMVIYEFDMAGGSREQGPAGTVRASGLGKATPFDLVNAAERVYQVLEPNVHRFGARASVSLL